MIWSRFCTGLSLSFKILQPLHRGMKGESLLQCFLDLVSLKSELAGIILRAQNNPLIYDLLVITLIQ